MHNNYLLRIMEQYQEQEWNQKSEQPEKSLDSVANLTVKADQNRRNSWLKLPYQVAKSGIKGHCFMAIATIIFGTSMYPQRYYH